MKVAIYVRVSTADQYVESQLYDLRELSAKRGFEVVKEYRDCGVSGRRARRPGLDALIADARQKKFSVVLVAAFDRVARSVKHFLQVMDEFDALGITFISRRENVDTSGAMGRMFLTLIGSIAELESDLIRERVLAGMRRAKLDGVIFIKPLTWEINKALGLGNEEDNAFRCVDPMCAAKPLQFSIFDRCHGLLVDRQTKIFSRASIFPVILS